MGKKRRKKKTTIFLVVEGYRELDFVNHLKREYKPENNNISFNLELGSGGTPDNIVKKALVKCDRDKSFCWLDEDFEPQFPLSTEVRKLLARNWLVPAQKMNDFLNCPLKDLQKEFNPDNRKPVIIVSQPICCENFLLKILNIKSPYTVYEHDKRDLQINTLKALFREHLATETETDFYKKRLPRETLEQRRTEVTELDLLLHALHQ